MATPRCLNRRHAGELRIVQEGGHHRRVAKSAPVREPAREVCAENSHKAVANHRAARRAERRDACRLQVRVLRAARAELLAIERHLQWQAVLLYQRIRHYIHAPEREHINSRIAARAKAKAPLGLWIPRTQRQIVHE